MEKLVKEAEAEGWAICRAGENLTIFQWPGGKRFDKTFRF